MSQAPSQPRSESPASTAPYESPLRRNWVWFTLQSIARLAFTIWFRARTRGIENLPPEGPALVLMNHLSFLDPLVAGVWLPRPISYLARHDLFDAPVVGWVLRHTYVMPIRRDKGSSAAMRATITRLEQGFLVGIFPEGSRSENGELGEIKPGFLAITRRIRVPIVPVGIAGTDKALALGDVFPKPRRVRVVIGEPLDPDEVEQLSAKGRQGEMLELIKRRLTECRREAEEWR